MTSILRDRSLLKITGEDSAKFLQNLITNDIYSDKPIYAMMLSPQGRFLFDIFIIRVEDSFLLDISESTKDVLLQKLDMYRINMKVNIEDISEISKICYGRLVPNVEIYYKDPRFEKLGYRFITSNEISEDNSYKEDKYNYSIPDGGIDLLYDKAMPQEYGAEELNAISYSKGCYVGQEVISRTKYQGQVRKKIYKITAENGLDSIKYGTEIVSYGQKIGMFCSGYNKNGIALIREENLDPTESAPTVDNLAIDLEKAIWY